MKKTFAAIGGAALMLAPLFAHAWPWSKDMANQISIKPQEQPIPFPKRSVPVPGTATQRVASQDAATKLVNPVEVTPESVNKGKQLFTIYCTPCHGVSGTGNGLVGEKLILKPYDLTSKEVQALPDGFIFGYITLGGAVMPSYANDLSPVERWSVINYVHHGLPNRAVVVPTSGQTK